MRKTDKERLEASLRRLKNLSGEGEPSQNVTRNMSDEDKYRLRLYLTTWVIPNIEMVLDELPASDYNYDLVM